MYVTGLRSSSIDPAHTASVVTLFTFPLFSVFMCCIFIIYVVYDFINANLLEIVPVLTSDG